jgi:hypothetical protein
MSDAIIGAVAMASFVTCLFFIHFWQETRDRLFLFFAIAFGTDAATRSLLAMGSIAQEHEPFFYLARLVTFLLIIAAIIDKNRSRRY